ncbi:hypothetical protein GQ457_17G007600 [Hibiscus cannabinus]
MFGCFDVEKNDGCCGLLLLWKEGIDVKLLSYSKSHIDVEIEVEQIKTRFTGMYGSFDRPRKHLDWELIDRLKTESQLPWLLGGDLNDILCSSERVGGTRKPRVEMDAFKEAMERNGLWDIKPSKGWFTWHYGDTVENHIRQRLDRFVASIPWLHLYGQCEIITEFTRASDHAFLFLNTDGAQRVRPNGDYFKFDTCWADEDECAKIVKDAWGIPGVDARCKKQLQGRIEQILEQDITEARLEALKSSKRELKTILDKEEKYWRQRSRIRWLKEGDRNTRFFHYRANNRRKKNMIKGIRNIEGEWLEGIENIFGVAKDFFSKLFQSDHGTTDPLILDAIEPCITPEMNEKLNAEFTEEEVKRAFLQINPNKAPGLDGLPASFFRKFWPTLSHDFIKLCLDLLKGRASMVDVNQTVIVLIPKIDSPTLMKHFRPISLCTVVYKTCSKVLVNRMKPLMSCCIAENQSAFVPGRLISDNVIVANELFHYLNGSKNGPNKGAAIKLDMEKAYDRVEWHFLSDVMKKMGFADGWIKSIMMCVTTVSFCLKINGEISDFFRPSRGLRQGDPLSPYLFLFCTQGLSAMLLKDQREGRIRGVRASQKGPRINHLLYADDCLLFIKNSEKEARRLKEVLTVYEASSGQKINVEKSSIYFSNGTSEQSKTALKSILNMNEDAVLGQYLGLPLIVGKSKMEAFKFLIENVDKRSGNWSKNLLSFGGREIFIKSVAQGIPAYAMCCFMLPDCILEPIVSTTRNFWWSGRHNERGWSHVAWHNLCKPKVAGGLGFRDLKSFNLALLAKQVWRLLCNKESLCFRTLSAKYFPQGDILSAKQGDKASYVWSSIFKAKEAFKDGFHWRLGVNSHAPRCWRQAHHRREEGPLGCYSRTPCADSMPLGAGGKNTIGGRKAPIGCHSRTPCANSWPLGAGAKQTMGRRKAPSGATPAHLVPTQGPSVLEASTP